MPNASCHRLLVVQDPLARRRVGALEDDDCEDVAAKRLRLGDLIEVRSGEIIPADGRILHATNVEVDESLLTGESLPVSKQTAPTPGAPLAERACMVYAGATVVAGSVLAIVTAAGPNTEMRRAMAMNPARAREIGMERQLRRITRRALPWSLTGGALVGLLSVVRGTPLRQAIASGVSVIVAAIPEGLPLVVTLGQLAAARRLSAHSVLIRNTRSIEALARLDVVCFDKTGTLSENRLEVKSVRPLNGFGVDAVLDAALSTAYARHTHRVEHATDEAVERAAEDAVMAARRLARGRTPDPSGVSAVPVGAPVRRGACRHPADHQGCAGSGVDRDEWRRARVGGHRRGHGRARFACARGGRAGAQPEPGGRSGTRRGRVREDSASRI